MLYLPYVYFCEFYTPHLISKTSSLIVLPLQPCQSLFVAPCSHVWHFKCIRPILNNEKLYPQFLCPNCRAVADLEADIEETVEAEAWEDADDGDAASVTDEHPPTVDGSTITADSSVEHDGNLTDLTSRLRLSEPSPLPPLSAIGAHSTPQRARRSASGSMGGDTTEIGESLSAAQTAATNDSRLRDPRSAMETLGGVVTPRNEAGPFVFDGGAGRARMPGALATSAASG